MSHSIVSEQQESTIAIIFNCDLLAENVLSYLPEHYALQLGTVNISYNKLVNNIICRRANALTEEQRANKWKALSDFCIRIFIDITKCYHRPLGPVVEFHNLVALMSDLGKWHNNGAKALCVACYLGWTQIIWKILRTGLDDFWAAESEFEYDFNCMEKLSLDYCWEEIIYKTPLMIAARAGDLAVVKLLLKYGAQPSCRNAIGSSALHDACDCGHVDVVRALLSKAGDMLQEMLEAERDTGDLNTGTPLHLAALGGHVDTVHELIEVGANINAVNAYYDTPLHLAVEAKNTKMVIVLIEAGAEVEELNYSGKTPLYIALCKGNSDIVLLLGAAADQSNSGSDNETSWEMAKKMYSSSDEARESDAKRRRTH